MKKLLFALSLTSACAFALNAASWFSGSVSSSTPSSVNGEWSGTSGDGVTVATDHFVLDTDTNEYLVFTPDQTKTPDTNSVDTVVVNAAFTPSALASLVTPPGDAQTAFVAAYTADVTPATNYYAYVGGAWVALSGASPVSSETIIALTIDVDYSAATPKVRFSVDSIVLGGSGADGNNWFTLSGKAQKTLTSVACTGCGKLQSVDGSIVVKTASIVVDGSVLPDATSNEPFAQFLEDAGYSDMSAAELSTVLNANVAETGVKAWQCYALGLGNPASLTASAIEEKLSVTAAPADTSTTSLKVSVPNVTAGTGYSLKYQLMKKVGAADWAAEGEPVSASGVSSLAIPLDGFTNGTRYRVDVVIIQNLQ